MIVEVSPKDLDKILEVDKKSDPYQPAKVSDLCPQETPKTSVVDTPDQGQTNLGEPFKLSIDPPLFENSRQIVANETPKNHTISHQPTVGPDNVQVIDDLSETNNSAGNLHTGQFNSASRQNTSSKKKEMEQAEETMKNCLSDPSVKPIVKKRDSRNYKQEARTIFDASAN